MTKKERIISIFLTIIISIICLVPILNFKVYAKESPKDLYRVYLNGKSIGIIKSKEKLENYINEEQKDLKKKYNVNNVYLPKGLYISKYKSYDTNITKEEDIYKLIKDKEDFTIKGYIITIDKEEDIVLNVLNKEYFENAVSNVVKAFVDSDDLEVFLSGENIVIEKTGKKIEDLYIKENITIKESFIPSNEEILLDEKDITKYLLFGEEIEEKKYVVKAGDTIETIADNNKLAVEELLVVNQDLKSKKNILSIGQEVSVALISPIITIVVEEHSVKEEVVEFSTEIEYNSSMIAGASEIKQEGKNGLQIVTQKLKYENGAIVNALIANTEVIDEVINKIKIVGTKSNATIDPSTIPDAGEWYWPTNKPYIITSRYGWRWGALHDATDISGTGHGSPIYSANNGVVYKVFYDNIGGNQIIILHADDIYTWYAHLSNFNVSVGQTVTRGQKIGGMGCTGNACTGTHLHFAAYKGIPYGGGYSFDSMLLYQ